MDTLITILVILSFIFPIWVAIHAWRKNYKAIAIILGISFFIPFLPQLIAIIVFFIAKPYQPNWDFTPNPRVYAGCGTIFYGASNRNNDGSFVTTQWFCIFYIPIIPIQSYRVFLLGSNFINQGAVITTTKSYSILENLRLNLKQIIWAYLLPVSFALFMVLIFKTLNSEIQQTAPSLIMGLLVAYLIAGYFLLRAK